MTNLVPIRSQAHAQALEERDLFLSRHPKLRALQEEIDRKLRTAQSTHNRLVLIHNLMMDAFLEHHRNLRSLSKQPL